MTVSAIPRHVLKLGGSLLDRPDLLPRIRQWLARQAPAERWLIVGGGELADSIRRADRLHGLGEEASHWLCARAMAIHAEMVKALLPESRWCASVRSLLNQVAKPSLVIIDPWTFLHDEEPDMSASPLPASWDVTSDSIAARLANLVGAAELTLLKSALPKEGNSIDEAVEAGYVDRYFPQALDRFPLVRVVNLRDDHFSEAIWRGNESV